MTDKCPICFEELHNDIGAMPCGHCVHKRCWKEITARLNEEETSSGDDSDNSPCPKCPICKRNAKSLTSIFLTFQKANNNNNSADQTSAAEQAVANLTTRNLHLQKRLRDLKSLSKDQSDLLFRILPLHEDLEEKFLRLQKEKKQLQHQLQHTLDEKQLLHNSKTNIYAQLSSLQKQKEDLEVKLQDSNDEIMDLHDIWNMLDVRLLRAKQKRREVKLELKRKLREEKEQRGKLILARDELFHSRMEKEQLEMQMRESRREALRLKKRMSKVLLKSGKNKKSKKGKKVVKKGGELRKKDGQVKSFSWFVHAGSSTVGMENQSWERDDFGFLFLIEWVMYTHYVETNKNSFRMLFLI